MDLRQAKICVTSVQVYRVKAVLVKPFHMHMVNKIKQASDSNSKLQTTVFRSPPATSPGFLAASVTKANARTIIESKTSTPADKKAAQAIISTLTSNSNVPVEAMDTFDPVTNRLAAEIQDLGKETLDKIQDEEFRRVLEEEDQDMEEADDKEGHVKSNDSWSDEVDKTIPNDSSLTYSGTTVGNGLGASNAAPPPQMLDPNQQAPKRENPKPLDPNRQAPKRENPNPRDPRPAAKKPYRRAHALLNLHLGSEIKGPLPEATWTKIQEALNLKIELTLLSGDWNPNYHIWWTRWEQNRVLVACANEETVTTFSKMVSDLKIDGQSFRAWRQLEYPHLCTLILPAGTKAFKGDIWQIFMGANGLEAFENQHGPPKIQEMKKGTRKLCVGVSEALATKIKSFDGKAPLGMHSIKAVVNNMQ